MVKSDWLTPEGLKTNVKDGISGAKEAFFWGVDNPRRNPIETAVEAIKAGIWAKGVKTGIDKWVKALSGVTIEEWKNATKQAARLYADRAVGQGAENWGKYYARAESTIINAREEFLKTGKTKEGFMKFWADMSKLSEV